MITLTDAEQSTIIETFKYIARAGVSAPHMITRCLRLLEDERQAEDKINKTKLYDVDSGKLVGEYNIPINILISADVVTDWLKAQPEAVRYSFRLAGLVLADGE